MNLLTQFIENKNILPCCDFIHAHVLVLQHGHAPAPHPHMTVLWNKQKLPASSAFMLCIR